MERLQVKNIEKTFEYMDKELIQYIDATDNMQNEYLESKISPDFVKLYNPEWNENISENEAFMKAIKLADEFWEVYIKHAIAEVEAIDIIIDKIENAKENYIVFETEMPYRKVMNLSNNTKVKYIIFKARREGYDVRTLIDSCKFKDVLVQAKNIDIARKLTGIQELIYVDNHGKLCCTQNLESAIKLVKYNEEENYL